MQIRVIGERGGGGDKILPKFDKMNTIYNMQYTIHTNWGWAAGEELCYTNSKEKDY